MSKVCIAAAGIYCGAGLMIPIPATIVAIIAVIIVRGLVWTQTKSIPWNIAVCALAILGTIVSLEGKDISIFRAFWVGVGYGAVGVGIIEVGKSAMMKALTVRFASAASVLFGIKVPKDKIDE